MLITTANDFRALVQRMKGRDFAFDFETRGLDFHDEELGIALAFEGPNQELEAHYIAFTHTLPEFRDVELSPIEEFESEDDDDEYEDDEDGDVVEDAPPEQIMYGVENEFIPLAEAIEIVRPLFEQPSHVLAIAHNLKFDLKHLWRMGIYPTLDLYDTMIAEWYVNENREGFGLKRTVGRVFGVQMDNYQDLHFYKEYPKEAFLATKLEDGARYAEDDARFTFMLCDRQSERLDEEGVDRPFWNIGMELTKVLTEMETLGVRIDRARCLELLESYSATAEEFKAKVWQVGMDMLEDLYQTEDELADTYMLTVSQLKKHGIEIVEDEHGTPFIYGRPVPRIMKSGAKVPRYLYFNVGSRIQLGHLLYDYMRISIPTQVQTKTNKDGSDGVDKDTLTVIRHFLGDACPQVVSDLLEWRIAEKLVSTYLRPWLEQMDENDAIHPTFNQHIARTGRLTSSNPNAQNIPSRGPNGELLRSLFIPHEGHSLVVADYAQLELRLLAHFSGDPDLLDAFVTGKDLHAVTGARQAGISYEELMKRVEDGDTEAKLLRTVGKSANFGLSYGMGAFKYQTYLLVNNKVYFELEAVQSQINGYNAAYSRLYEWKKEIHEEVRKVGFVRTLSGRKRRLPAARSRDRGERGQAERQGVNVYAQGGGADLINRAMIKMQPQLKALGGSLILQVHDEIVASVPTEHVEEAKRIIEEAMLEMSPKLNCPLAVEAHHGDNWYAAK